jgi:hypothetical protein
MVDRPDLGCCHVHGLAEVRPGLSSVGRRLLLARDLLGREPMRAVRAAGDRPWRLLGADVLVIGEREENDAPRCAARANDHAARKDPQL